MTLAHLKIEGKFDFLMLKLKNMAERNGNKMR
jgi:hypothetical protein